MIIIYLISSNGGATHWGSLLALYMAYDPSKASLEMFLKCACNLVLLSHVFKTWLIFFLFSFVMRPRDPIEKHTRLHSKPFASMSVCREEYLFCFLTLALLMFGSRGTVSSPRVNFLVFLSTTTMSGRSADTTTSDGRVLPLILCPSMSIYTSISAGGSSMSVMYFKILLCLYANPTCARALGQLFKMWSRVS